VTRLCPSLPALEKRIPEREAVDGGEYPLNIAGAQSRSVRPGAHVIRKCLHSTRDERVSAADGDLAGLLDRVAAGDRAAFRDLYGLTASKLLAAVRRILGSSVAAEDAVQEAYVRIWRKAGDFDTTIASPIAWMTTIARHVAIDMLRRSPERISAASATLDAEAMTEIAAPSVAGDPLEADRLSACLGKLDDERRSMVVLAYCYGWSREELGARFGRPVATVKTALRRSLIALKECLGGN
jgi:RNA polymerase sigma-70 factor (ECF subfamily)